MTVHRGQLARRPLLRAAALAFATACGAGATVGAAGPRPRRSPGAETATTGGAPGESTDAATGALSGPQEYVDAAPMAMALTFDDGPGPYATAELLTVLRQYGVTATFFVIGANVEKYPRLARRVAEAGHVLGNHTWSHPRLDDLSEPQIRAEIERTTELVVGVTGRRPTLFRAPGGHFTPATLAVCADLGLRPVSWSVDPEDWSNPGADVIVDRVLAEARTGSIVLNHDGCLTPGFLPARGGPADRSQTVAAVRHYLPRLVDAGYRFTVPTA
ncbi:polysaccharide deacetylase family protein [Kitasatospora sp. NPDC005748]|uniref:polysaccharide deacetylase family protein n=1 Tax=Kitasatospora sp. NPDC005748 TaxID=3157063 RepID=UPI0033D8D8B0